MRLPAKPATYDDDYATRKIAGLSDDMKFDVSLARDYEDLPEDPAERKDWIYQRFMKDRFRTIYGVDKSAPKRVKAKQAKQLARQTSLPLGGRSVRRRGPKTGDLRRRLSGLVGTWGACSTSSTSAAWPTTTLVLYTSDHGYFLGDHGWYDKRFMYEPSLKIPLVARYPAGCPGGQVSRNLAMNVDFAPTILDFAGVEAPSQMQGTSLRPLLEGKSPDDWRTATYYAYYEDSWQLVGAGDDQRAEPYQYFTPHRIGPHRGVRTERYKLIEYYTEGDYWELFDLDQDPDELRNVYNDPEYETVVSEMRRTLQQTRERYRDG